MATIDIPDDCGTRRVRVAASDDQLAVEVGAVTAATIYADHFVTDVIDVDPTDPDPKTEAPRWIVTVTVHNPRDGVKPVALHPELYDALDAAARRAVTIGQEQRVDWRDQTWHCLPTQLIDSADDLGSTSQNYEVPDRNSTPDRGLVFSSPRGRAEAYYAAWLT